VKRLLAPARRWVASGTCAVLDQSLTSGANFALNLALARWLAPADYGAFAVAFSIFLLYSTVHNALVLEPASIIGPADHAGHLAGYLRAQIGVHFAVCGPAVPLMAGAGVVLVAFGISPPVGRGLLGLAVALPFILLFWSARRFQYIGGTQRRAPVGSGLYALLLLASVALLERTGLLGVGSSFLVMGAASLGASALLLRPILLQAKGGEAPPSMGLRSLFAKQWSYGRWVLAAGLLTAAGMQVYSLISAGMLGLEATGALRAMEIVMLPMAQSITALSMLGLPILAASYGEGDLATFRRRGWILTVLLTGAALVYEICLLAFYREIERILYGGRFAENAWLIPVMGLIPVFTALSSGVGLMLRAAQVRQHYLLNGIVTATAGGLLTPVLAAWLGLFGVCLGLVLTFFASFLALTGVYRRTLRAEQPEPLVATAGSIRPRSAS
jgi:O-antigen/teichoic acid export membrane protein